MTEGGTVTFETSRAWRETWERAITAIAKVPEQEFDAATIEIIAGPGGTPGEIGELFAGLMDRGVLSKGARFADGRLIFRGAA